MTSRLRIVLALSAAAALFGGGVLVARATPGGATKNKLSFAGRVSPKPTAGTALRFTFKNGTATCTPPDATPSFDADGNFVAELDLGAATSCPASFFDGGDVTYTIVVGGGTASADLPLNPVPYAKYADKAAIALAAQAANGALEDRLAKIEGVRTVWFALDTACSTSTCAIARGSSGVSVTHPAAADYRIGFSPAFTAPPVCVCTATDYATKSYCANVDPYRKPTTSEVQVILSNCASTTVDVPFSCVCTGK